MCICVYAIAIETHRHRIFHSQIACAHRHTHTHSHTHTHTHTHFHFHFRRCRSPASANEIADRRLSPAQKLCFCTSSRDMPPARMPKRGPMVTWLCKTECRCHCNNQKACPREPKSHKYYHQHAKWFHLYQRGGPCSDHCPEYFHDGWLQIGECTDGWQH